MRRGERLAREWQREQFRRYEKIAARRILANAIVFLIVWTLLMAAAAALSAL